MELDREPKKQLLHKIAECKKSIKRTEMVKDGKNNYSNYTYFTPSKIEQLVSDVCNEEKLLTTFELKRNEFGEFGVLTIWDTENGESLSFEMATAIPEIKATNVSQQIGGCMTYTERYIKTSVFGITENNLDFDTTENTKERVEKKPEYKQNSKDMKLHKRGNYEEKINSAETVEELEKIWFSIPESQREEYKEIVNLQKSLLNGK